MKIFRFMSEQEFKALIDGETIKNKIKHRCKTNSVGFCFMNFKDDSPEEAYKYLSGIVSDDVCVIFETERDMKKSFGIYANPYSSSFFDEIVKDEYNTTEYNIENYKMLKIAIPKWNKEHWKWETDAAKIIEQLNKLKKQRRKEEEEDNLRREAITEFKNKKSMELWEFIDEFKKGYANCGISINDKYITLPIVLEKVEARSDGEMEITFRSYVGRK